MGRLAREPIVGGEASQVPSYVWWDMPTGQNRPIDCHRGARERSKAGAGAGSAGKAGGAGLPLTESR